MSAHLGHEHQVLGVELAELGAPYQPQATRHVRLLLTILFRLWSRRLIVRQIVASLTFTPHTPKRNSLLCLWVTPG